MNGGALIHLVAVGAMLATLCNTGLAQTAPPVAFVQASNVACKVGRANVKPGETVTWQGQCADGLGQGPGIAQWSEGGKPTLRFEGTFAKGLLEGKGKMIGADGDRYEGDYKGGLRHGYGVYVAANGTRFGGEYVNNQRGAEGPAPPALATPASPPPQTAQALRPNAPAATPSMATPPAALMAKDGQSNTADSSAIGARPIQATNPRDSVTMRGGPYAVPAPWGTELRFNCLGAWPNGETIAPNGFELKNSARSGKYADNTLPNDRLLEFLNQVQQFLLKSCADKGHPVSANATLYLFTDGLPASYGHGFVVFAARDARRNSWTVQNLAADSYIREQEQAAAAAARQKAEAERQVQEAERRRVAEQAEKERRAAEKQRQDQVAAAQAAAQAEVQKREQASKVALDKFGKRNNVVDFVPPDKLKANPFAYEGKQIATVLRFKEMRSSSSAIFSASFILGIGYQILVIDLPKTLFGEEQSAVLAVKVLGTTTIDEPTGKLTVPQLKFLDAIKCQRDDCGDVLK